MEREATSRLKLRRRTLSLHNVVSLTLNLQDADQLLEIIDGTVDEFRRALVRNGYYVTGPTVFRALPDSRDFTLMTTLGNRMNLVGAHGTGFEFNERLTLDTDYFYRHVDIDEPVPYDDIERMLQEAGLTVQTIYHVILDVYGETMLDLYIEAVER
ncbi:hypothetical protein [Leifsonia sp. AG29]|uniref:hypothetical protein n=1 Tax=Leifsonia sp. AG29 TaxID=2598860 RepID=UPI001E35E64D|nr:hypothetical protein [Leifsonia sp. AG29]